MEILMQKFDFNAEAILFYRPNGKGRAYPLTIRRFSKVCEAILYAIEELTPFVVKSCSIESGDSRITGTEILEMYERTDFPLLRAN